MLNWNSKSRLSCSCAIVTWSCWCPLLPTLGTSTARQRQWKAAAMQRNSDRAALSCALGPPQGPDDQAPLNPAWRSHPSHQAATEAPGVDHVHMVLRAGSWKKAAEFSSGIVPLQRSHSSVPQFTHLGVRIFSSL